jgi:uncharacterized cupin superfamily protein
MPIYLTEKRPDSPRVVDWDAAWRLFLPHHPGDVPPSFPKSSLGAMTIWAWDALGRLAGRLGRSAAAPIWFLVPTLHPAGREYVIRVASFWDDDVYLTDDHGDATGGNLWLPPLVHLEEGRSPTDLGARLTLEENGDRVRIFFPQLGAGRLHLMLEDLAPGHASARLHSHSLNDEYYLVMSGRGTLRMGRHSIPVQAGDLIGKPTGPDLTSQIVADRGERIVVLDMEAWPDASLRGKDVVHYPDFAEVYIRGPGWENIVPDATLAPSQDIGVHYDRGYRRQADGSFVPVDLPGAPARGRD